MGIDDVNNIYDFCWKHLWKLLENCGSCERSVFITFARLIWSLRIFKQKKCENRLRSKQCVGDMCRGKKRNSHEFKCLLPNHKFILNTFL